LSAAILGLGISVVAAVRVGVNDLGADIGNSLSCASVASLTGRYAPRYLPQDFASEREADYASNQDSENLGYYYGRRVEWFRRNMDSGNYTEGTWDGTGTEGMSAGQYLDLIELMAQELESRGDYPVPGQPTADELRAQFNSAIGC